VSWTGPPRLAGIGCGAPVIDQPRAQITIPVCDPVPDLMTALRILDTAGIVPVDLGLRRPSGARNITEANPLPGDLCQALEAIASAS
jgi:hypothetical protein